MPRGRKKIENSKSELIHVRISEELSKSLESFCKASNVKKSEGIRLLLESILKWCSNAKVVKMNLNYFSKQILFYLTFQFYT